MVELASPRTSGLVLASGNANGVGVDAASVGNQQSLASGYSDLPEVVGPAQVVTELEVLKTRREALVKQQARILQLQQIEEETVQLDGTISDLERIR